MVSGPGASKSLGVGLHPREPNPVEEKDGKKIMQREIITCHQTFDPMLFGPGGAEVPKRPEQEDREEGESR